MRQRKKMAGICVKFWSRSFSVYFIRKEALRTGGHERGHRLRERSLRGDNALGCFRGLEAPEQQPEGEKDDLERCDGKGKDRPVPSRHHVSQNEPARDAPE